MNAPEIYFFSCTHIPIANDALNLAQNESVHYVLGLVVVFLCAGPTICLSECHA